MDILEIFKIAFKAWLFLQRTRVLIMNIKIGLNILLRRLLKIVKNKKDMTFKDLVKYSGLGAGLLLMSAIITQIDSL